MEIIKVSNYKTFADTLKNKTGCDVLIRPMGKEHTHYQLSKMGISLGVLCIDKGIASFAPFVTLDSAENDQYINVQYFPMLDDFVSVLQVLSGMFTYIPENI